MQHLQTKIIQMNPHETEGKALPFKLAQECLTFCPYGSVHSIGCKIYFYTGCRLTEINKMYRDKLIGNYLYWQPGKNQKGFRKEWIPDDLIDELQQYWRTHRIPDNKIIGISSETFRKYFWKDILPYLSEEWRSKKTVLRNNLVSEAFSYSLKSFRKTFATIWFYHYYKKFNDAGIAVDLVAKKMKHATKGMTISHYIEACEQIEAEKYLGLLPHEIIQKVSQQRILDYIPASSGFDWMSAKQRKSHERMAHLNTI